MEVTSEERRGFQKLVAVYIGSASVEGMTYMTFLHFSVAVAVAVTVD